MLVDLPLVTRVEQSAGRLTAAEVGALAARSPASGAASRPLDGGVLAAMGPGRYVNRGVGVGLGGTPTAVLLDELESFFGQRGLPPMLEVSPWAPTELVAELAARGYTVQWFRDVFAHPLGDLPTPSVLRVHEVHDDPAADWAADWAAILAADTEAGSAAREIALEFCDAVRHVANSVHLVALVGEQPVATGSLSIVDGVGWLGGAATLAAQRGQGAQHALLVERLHRARSAGCTLAAATALPHGVSARNLQRVGFRLLYSQTVMARLA